MEDILSQDEIDALLHGVDDGDISTESQEVDDSGVAVYDFSSHDNLVRGRLPTLELINERFARQLRVGLFNLMRRNCELFINGIKIMKFGEYIQNLSLPTSLNMVKMEPLRGTSLFTLEAKLVFRLVDNFFGGTGRHAKIEGREFTPTELRVVQMILEQVFHCYQEAWEPVHAVSFETIGTEVNPAMATILAPDDSIVVNSFRIELDGNGGDFYICLPYAMIEPIRDLLDSGISGESTFVEERWVKALRRDILRASVSLDCTLVEKNMSLRDVIDLDEGDIISVDMPETLVLRANNVPIYKTKIGQSNGNLALKILERTSIDLIDD